jgi:diguanylate cyclase (GGDEF)-like protein
VRLTLAGRPPDAGLALGVPRRTALLAGYTAATIVLGLGAVLVATLAALSSAAPVFAGAIAIPGLDPAVAGLAGVAVWTLFGLAGGTRILRDPGGHVTLTFHLPFIAAATILGGPVAGAWVALLATIEWREIREVPWYGTLANHAALAVAALAGGIVIEGALAVASGAGLGTGLSVRLVAGIAGTVVMAVGSAALTAGVVVLRDGLTPRDAVALLDASFRRTAVAETLIGWLFVVVWVTVGWWAPAVLTVVVFALWRGEADGRDLERDELTGVLSRGAFAHRAAEAAERARRGVDGAAYLYLDLDGFKALNDGPRNHLVGDQVLMAVGERLRRSVRVTDAVGRRGGDEFTILFAGVGDEATAERLAGRIHDTISAPYHTDDGEKVIGVSVGVALAVPGGRDFEPDLRQHADAAMYEAKAAGGGVRVWHDPGPGGEPDPEVGPLPQPL